MFTLRDISYNFFYVLFKRKGLFAFIWLIVTSLVLFYAYVGTPLFRVNTLILVHQNPKQQLILFRDINTPAQVSQRIHPAFNLKEIVTSRNLNESIVKKYRLDARLKKRMTEPEEIRDILKFYIAAFVELPFRTLDTLGILKMEPTDYFNKAVEELMYERIEVGVLAETEVLNINVYYDDPKLALAISSSTIEGLREKSADLEAKKSFEAYLFAEEQVKRERKKLKAIEDRYLNFKEKQKIADLERERNLLLVRLDELMAERMKTEREMALNVAELAEVETLIKSEESGELISKLSGDNPYTKGIKEDSIEEGRKLKPAWNQSYIALKKKAEEHRIIIAGQKEQLRTLNTQTEEIQTEIEALPGKEVELRRLQRERDNQEELYQGLQDKMNEFKIQRMSERTEFDIKVLNTPSLPEYPEPVWPQWDLFALLAVSCGILAGILVVFILEQFSETVSDESQLEMIAQTKVLASIPDLS